MGYDAYATVVYGVKTDYHVEEDLTRLDWLDERGCHDLDVITNHFEDNADAYVGKRLVSLGSGDSGVFLDQSFHNVPLFGELTNRLKELFPDKVIGYWLFLQESY